MSEIAHAEAGEARETLEKEVSAKNGQIDKRLQFCAGLVPQGQ